MNIYRLLGDLCLVSANPILAYKIIVHGPDGISLATQILRLLMFSTRYIDVFIYFISPYNTSMKCVLIISTLMLVIVLGWQKLVQQGMKIRMRDLSLALVIVGSSLFLSVRYNYSFTLMEILWSFSRIIEPLVEVPQLTQLCNMDVLDSWLIIYYSSSCARVAFYVGNWIYRYRHEGFFDTITVFCGFTEALVVAGFFTAWFVLVKKNSALGELGSKEVLADNSVYIADQKMPIVVVVDEVA